MTWITGALFLKFINSKLLFMHLTIEFKTVQNDLKYDIVFGLIVIIIVISILQKKWKTNTSCLLFRNWCLWGIIFWITYSCIIAFKKYQIILYNTLLTWIIIAISCELYMKCFIKSKLRQCCIKIFFILNMIFGIAIIYIICTILFNYDFSNPRKFSTEYLIDNLYTSNHQVAITETIVPELIRRGNLVYKNLADAIDKTIEKKYTLRRDRFITLALFCLTNIKEEPIIKNYLENKIKKMAILPVRRWKILLIWLYAEIFKQKSVQYLRSMYNTTIKNKRWIILVGMSKTRNKEGILFVLNNIKDILELDKNVSADKLEEINYAQLIAKAIITKNRKLLENSNYYPLGEMMLYDIDLREHDISKIDEANLKKLLKKNKNSITSYWKKIYR